MLRAINTGAHKAGVGFAWKGGYRTSPPGCLRSALPRLGLGGRALASHAAASWQSQAVVAHLFSHLWSLGEATHSKPSDVDAKTRPLSLWNGNRKVAAEITLLLEVVIAPVSGDYELFEYLHFFSPVSESPLSCSLSWFSLGQAMWLGHTSR